MHAQLGMTYLWMLFLVFVLSLGLGKTLEVYSAQLQREKEADLLYVGHLYQKAIWLYYQNSPGYEKKFPQHLEDLLRDPRYLTTQRYLRSLYLDPITDKPFAIVYAPEGGILGVYSQSNRKPWKQKGFLVEDFNHRDSYSEWLFIASPHRR